MISFQIRLMGATSLLLLTIMLNYSKQGWLRSVATHWLWSSTPTSYQVATKKSQIHRICRPPAQQIWCQKSSDASNFTKPHPSGCAKKFKVSICFNVSFTTKINENRLWNTPDLIDPCHLQRLHLKPLGYFGSLPILQLVVFSPNQPTHLKKYAQVQLGSLIFPKKNEGW